MPEYVLGVNSGVHKHDGAAALLADGHLVAMVEQERLSRRKQAWGEAAAEAISACLALAGIRLEDIAHVAFGWDEALYAAAHGAAFDEAAFLRAVFPPALFGDAPLPPVRYVRHHLAHAASAFWTSGFAEAAILVLDGRGELAATALAHGTARGIELLDERGLEDSLGTFYALAAEWCGLSYLGAGKLMGLAAYGRPSEPMPLLATDCGYRFDGLGPPDPDPSRRFYHQQRDFLTGHFRRATYPHAPGDGGAAMSYANFAASVQRALEEAVLGLARLARRRTGAADLCLAGGVALNCSLNARLAASGLFARLHVPPCAQDAGVSLGAALAVWRELHPETPAPERLAQAGWGMAYGDEAIAGALAEAGLHAERLAEDELVARVAAALAEHRVVGWFQGRAEMGPRALGARSLLGNPCRRENLIRINAIKGREVWRPLAPSVVEEEHVRWFDSPAPSEHMLVAAEVRPEVRPLIPAVVHADGSARPQLVRRATQPLFWCLLRTFGERSGAPLVVNTSLNLRGEPIANSPRDALAVFAEGGLDLLALGPYLVARGA